MKTHDMTLTLYFAHISTAFTVGSPAAHSVYQQIKGHSPIIKWEDNGQNFIFPGHMLLEMIVERSTETVETPADANCK